ncbi:hypothetical protein [Streptomyces sp. NPDC005017]|uniref:hypothetical protein n=1 Tax=Streptomyces sp. NPDC005017 TaxID=3364706 RepID=UPI00368FEE66
MPGKDAPKTAFLAHAGTSHDHALLTALRSMPTRSDGCQAVRHDAETITCGVAGPRHRGLTRR